MNRYDTYSEFLGVSRRLISEEYWKNESFRAHCREYIVDNGSMLFVQGNTIVDSLDESCIRDVILYAIEECTGSRSERRVIKSLLMSIVIKEHVSVSLLSEFIERIDLANLPIRTFGYSFVADNIDRLNNQDIRSIILDRPDIKGDDYLMSELALRYDL